MQNTPNYGWPYPESGDHTRTWEYWQNLAIAADASLKSVANKMVPLTWAPTITGLTLGNGTLTSDACRAGNLVAVSIRVVVPASPTTAWINAATFCTLPVPPRQIAVGSLFWLNAGAGNVGIVFSYGAYLAAGQMALSAHAVVGSGIQTVGPGNKWGVAAWGAGAELALSMVYTAN